MLQSSIEMWTIFKHLVLQINIIKDKIQESQLILLQKIVVIKETIRTKMIMKYKVKIVITYKDQAIIVVLCQV